MVEIIDPTMLPFIGAFVFVFALVFGLLSYVNRFNKAVNLLIAAVFGLFSVLYEPLVIGLQTFLPIAAIIFAALFFFLILKEVFKRKEGDKEIDTFPMVVALGILLILLGIFWPQLNLEFAGLNSTNVFWLLGIAVVVLIFILAYSQKESK